MLALLVVLQAVTKPLGQLVTGSFVNAVLAITGLVAGLGSGIIVAVISPVLAYLLGIAPQILTVPAIMIGNTLFVILLHFVVGGSETKAVKRILGWIAAAATKFAAMYAVVVWGICGFLAENLLDSGVLKEPMIKVLSTTFAWPQFVTALIGGGAALLIVPMLRKALHK